MTELHYQSLGDVCRQIKSGARSSVGVTEHQLERISALDGELKSFAMVLADDALAQAEALDAQKKRAEPLGALHGVPIGIKDLLYTKGIVTASGTKVMADFVPDYDATVVTRLKQAGAVILGKTQLTEGAFGSHHPDIESPRNPYDTAHWPGVSSSGSGVSVAAGMVYGALGSDTGGSIRFPSASCGLVGIKPTYGRVSRYGAFPLSETLDHIGPMTRTVEDAARLLGVIAGRDENDATSLHAPVPNYLNEVESINGLCVGVDWAYVSDGVDAVVVEGIRTIVTLLADLGATIVEVSMPREYHVLVEDWGVTCGVDCAKAHKEMFPAKAELYGPALTRLLEQGLAVDQAKYDELEVLRAQFRRGLDKVLSQVDLLISPCMTTLPPRLDVLESEGASDGQGMAPFITFTAPFDYSGHPTLTLPIDTDVSGLPRSFQFIGPHLGEGLLIGAGLAYEKAMGAFPVPPIA